MNVWIKRPKRNDEDAIPLSNAITVSPIAKPCVKKWADNAIAYMCSGTNDMQNAGSYTFLLSSVAGRGHGLYVDENNLWQVAVVFTVQRIVKHTWLNDRDQFLQADKPLSEEFINDCLVWMLFNGSNLTAGADGLEWQGKSWSLVNHFIPYTEEEVGSPSRFESDFLANYMKDKTYSSEALAVLEAGKVIWQAYFVTSFPHSIRDKFKLNRADVGWYQIRQAFKDLSSIGDCVRPVNFSSFESAYAILTEKIRPQVHELGFLKK